MKKVWILLANGFEETEAIGTWDAIKRGGIEGVELVSIHDTTEVIGAHGLHLQADRTLASTNGTLVDAVALPGGMGGANNLAADENVGKVLLAHYEAGKLVAAMCAAPLVLARLGILEGRKATIYPGMETEIEGSIKVSTPVVTDGNVITARGPRYAFPYGVEIVRYLLGNDVANNVAHGLLLHE